MSYRIHDEIQTAYDAIASQYEEAWLRGDSEAERIRRIIDAALEVVSDPERQKQHDEWIEHEEKEGTRIEEAIQGPEASSSVSSTGQEQEGIIPQKQPWLRLIGGALLVLLAVLVFLWGNRYKHLGSSSGFTYVHDRLTGNILTVIGPVITPAKKRDE